MFAIRLGLICRPSPELPLFWEALALCNGEDCGSSPFATINVAMILDTNYLRDTMAAMLSMLQHSTCPKNLVFHFLFAHDDALELFSSIKSTFLYLKMKIYRFDSNRVCDKISKSIRQALDQPLNYARIYLTDTIPEDVKHVIYLDSDLVVVDDIAKLYGVDMKSQVGVEGHGYINGGGGRVAAFLAVVEGGGLPKERELRGRTADEAKANDKHIREEPRCG
ncbi:putative galacturonosyltransferase-like 4 [Glycine max]|nr:putative galacturonosyltransferase-like 4 [Glycine max]